MKKVFISSILLFLISNVYSANPDFIRNAESEIKFYLIHMYIENHNVFPQLTSMDSEELKSYRQGYLDACEMSLKAIDNYKH